MKRVVFLGVLSLVLFTGCRGIGGTIVLTGGHPHVEHAPPAHAPAHGRRHQRLYHYYPNAEFYFDVSRNMYFYLSVNLPLRLRSHLNSGYVEIEMDNDRPYKRHSYHKNKYKKHKYKYKDKKHKYKSKKHSKKRGKYKKGDDDERHNRGRGNGRN